MTTHASTGRGILAAAMVSLMALGAASTVEAAIITWGAATNIVGDSDVSTTGTLAGAFNLGRAGVATTTVNGVTFSAFGVSPPTGSTTVGNFTLSAGGPGIDGNNLRGSVNAPFANLTAEYQALLGSAIGPANDNFVRLTMTGLTLGDTYQFQVWANDSTLTGTGAITAIGADFGLIRALDLNTTNAVGGLGQYALGTFIADNASQQILFGGTSYVTAFQLRDVASGTVVPEPGSALVGMLALGLCGAGTTRRRRAMTND